MAAETLSLPIETVRARLNTAIEEGELSVRGRLQDAGEGDPSVPVPIWSDPPRIGPPRIVWDTTGSYSAMVGSGNTVLEYIDVEVERVAFDAWVLLTKPPPTARKLHPRFVGVPEALSRLRDRAAKARNEQPSDEDLAQVIVDKLREEDGLRCHWIDAEGHSVQLSSDGWALSREHSKGRFGQISRGPKPLKSLTLAFVG